MLCCHFSRPCSFPPGSSPRPSFSRNREMQWVTSKCCTVAVLSLNLSGGVQIQDPVSVLFLNLRCQGSDVYSRIMWTSDLGRRMHRHQRDEREAHKLHDQGAATNLRPTRPRSIEKPRLLCYCTALGSGSFPDLSYSRVLRTARAPVLVLSIATLRRLGAPTLRPGPHYVGRRHSSILFCSFVHKSRCLAWISPN